MNCVVENLDFQIDGIPILSQIQMEWKQGEILSILGANGSGKTTLIQCCTGLLQPNHGNIRYEQRELKTLSATERSQKISILEQHLSLPYPMKVEEIVAIGRTPYLGWSGILSSKDKQVIEYSMKRTFTWEWKQRKFETLSSGEKQRVWIAMALAQETSFLFLDEPLSHLDLKVQMEMMQLLNSLKEEGKAICLVNHDIHLSYRFSDKVLLLKKGKSVAFGKVAETMNPSNLQKTFDISFAQHQDVFIPSMPSF